MSMICTSPAELVHKETAQGSVPATLISSTKYVLYKPDDPQFATLMEPLVNKDMPKIMDVLDVARWPLPMTWTVDFMLCRARG